MNDDLGDRMKLFERFRTSDQLDTLDYKYVYARIDGRGFSKFTRGLDKPFDIGLQKTMQAVTEALVKKTHAIAGYTQSDEINLAWEHDKLFFERKIQKLSSILASLATSHFIMDGGWHIPASYFDRYPHFDARIFELPDEHELTNAFLWRYKDAYRNSISMIGQANFSHKKLHKKSQKDVKHMLAEIGIFEDDFSANSIHGTFVTREKVLVETENGVAVRDKLTVDSGKNFSQLDHMGRVAFILGNKND